MNASLDRLRRRAARPGLSAGDEQAFEALVAHGSDPGPRRRYQAGRRCRAADPAAAAAGRAGGGGHAGLLRRRCRRHPGHLTRHGQEPLRPGPGPAAPLRIATCEGTDPRVRASHLRREEIHERAEGTRRSEDEERGTIDERRQGGRSAGGLGKCASYLRRPRRRADDPAHLDPDVLAEFRAGLITGRRGARIAAHLAGLRPVCRPRRRARRGLRAARDGPGPGHARQPGPAPRRRARRGGGKPGSFRTGRTGTARGKPGCLR